MNTTEKIIQFALQRKFGLNFDSSEKDIESALGKPEGPFDDNFMLYEDLEIGLNRNCEIYKDPFRKVSYFKFKVGACRGFKHFKVPGIEDVKFRSVDADMREVMQVLVNHSFWFEHVYELHYKEEDRGIRSLDRQVQFHFKKQKKRWLLDCYYCNSF